MDYGAMLKKTVGNPGRKSTHYVKQKPFGGSDRQIRGLILRMLLEETALTVHQLQHATNVSQGRLVSQLVHLREEGFILQKGEIVTLSE